MNRRRPPVAPWVVLFALFSFGCSSFPLVTRSSEIVLPEPIEVNADHVETQPLKVETTPAGAVERTQPGFFTFVSTDGLFELHVYCEQGTPFLVLHDRTTGRSRRIGRARAWSEPDYIQPPQPATQEEQP
jgi:hypothetical protein